jgi:hypothetical protein
MIFYMHVYDSKDQNLARTHEIVACNPISAIKMQYQLMHVVELYSILIDSRYPPHYVKIEDDEIKRAPLTISLQCVI